MADKPCPDCGTIQQSDFDFYYDKKKAREYRKVRCRGCYRAKRQKSLRKWRLDETYGLTELQYELILKSQNGVCAICGLPPMDQNLAVDHDHVTGKIRGLLHTACNLVLGNSNDNPHLLRAAADYLEKFHAASI